MSRLGGHFRNNKRFWYGLIGAAVIVVILLGVTALATAHIGKQTLTGDFAQAGGVRPGDKVRVAWSADEQKVVFEKIARDTGDDSPDDQAKAGIEEPSEVAENKTDVPKPSVGDEVQSKDDKSAE